MRYANLICLGIFLGILCVIHAQDCRTVHMHEKCDGEKVKFFINTRENPDEMERIIFSDSENKISDSPYEPGVPTKLIIHGVRSDPDDEALTELKNAYLTVDAYPKINVIMVDWSELTSRNCTRKDGVRNVKYAGKCIAFFILALDDLQAGQMDLHALGHLTGAQAIATVAYFLKPYKMTRATGLDPRSWKSEKQLSKDSAQFVDVLHTTGRSFSRTILPKGHLDFYINHPLFADQPGCLKNTTNIPENVLYKQAALCSTLRAVTYFTESINTTVGFYGYRCSNPPLRVILKLVPPCEKRKPYVLMGEFADIDNDGIILLRTNREPPFARGMDV